MADEQDELKRTQLYQWHVDHGGRMVPFAGWEMPVQYPTGPIEEHHITRRSAGLFDIDHMGQIVVSGADAEAYLNRLVTWEIATMQLNEAHYALMCYENGGVVDDVFIYRLPGRWFVVVNASNLDKDLAWMQQHVGDFDVTVTDVSTETYMMALQGPRAIPLLQRLCDADLEAMQRFTAIEAAVAGIKTIIGRTGYTGEDGVELFLPAESAESVWQAILDEGPRANIEVAPIGLAARDSLRFEPAFPLYGHEINADTTPLEANLSWACSFDSDFIGRAALLAQKAAGVQKKLIGFELTERGVPREGYVVADADGVEIGVVATGLYAPTVDKYCGHAFVDPAHAKVGTPLQILIRDRPKAAVVVKRPFYRPSYRA
ncbi:MAG: glycine cleavage system aminomethyltransferase GcvT [Caldilineaceae bacterium]